MLELDRRLPVEQRPRPGDVRPALHRVVLRQRPVLDREREPVIPITISASWRMVNSRGIAEVDRPRHVVGRGHHRRKPSIRSST
jgi:hypothetical protein